MSIIFNEEKVRESEFEFKKITLRPEQKVMVQRIAELMSEFIPLSVMALKGNCWLSLVEWQTTNKKVTQDITAMSQEERLATIKEIFEYSKNRLKKMLIQPNEQEIQLDEAFEKAFEFYKTIGKKD